MGQATQQFYVAALRSLINEGEAGLAPAVFEAMDAANDEGDWQKLLDNDPEYLEWIENEARIENERHGRGNY